MLYTESAKLWHKCYMDSFYITSSRIQRKGGRKGWSERRKREKERAGGKEGKPRKERKGKGRKKKGREKEREGKRE